MARTPTARSLTSKVTTFDLEGPFFRTDPAKTFRQNVRSMMDALAVEGARDAVAQLQVTEGSRAPLAYTTNQRVSWHVRGRTSSLAGKRWAVTAKVGPVSIGSRREAMVLMAAASVLEGRLGVFRRTTSRLRKARAINAAELLKGLQ